MNTEVTAKLTRERITDLLCTRGEPPPDGYPGPERRRFPRWPSEDSVEIHSVNDKNQERSLASVCSLSEGGLGMSGDEYFELSAVLSIVLHLPEASFHARAAVRYCRKVRGEYMTGVEFIF